MGNSLPGVPLLRNGDCSYHIQLSQSAAIDLTERKFEQTNNGKLSETWKASYTVDGSTCALTLIKTRALGVGKSNGDQRLDISLHDDIRASAALGVIAQTEAGLLEASIWHKFIKDKSKDAIWIKTSQTNNAWGGVTVTHIHWYGFGRRKGYFVMELKKKSMHEKPYMGTVAHYYANNIQNVLGETDIGLSVITTFVASADGSLNFAVDGPLQHPAAALLYMFDAVFRSGIWKPTSCPHCANNSIIQRQHSMFSQYESEDSDNLLATGPHNRKQNPRGVLVNDGVIKGNYNGNLIVIRQLKEFHLGGSD